jgi:hypothetical protein
MMKSTYRHVVFAVLFLCFGLPRSSVSEAARICQSPNVPYHTWVRMSYSCSQAGNCGLKNPYTQWNNIGYENGNGGSLRDESKEEGGVPACTSWNIGDKQGKIALAATAQQERSAISALVAAGWSTAKYGIVGGAINPCQHSGSDPDSWSWYPRASKCAFGVCIHSNVCWTFTCAYSAYLYRVLGVRPRAIGSEFSIRSEPEIPTEWTCKREQYGTGDGCQCNCGAFDPDCNSFAAVSVDCPNNDDICIPGPQEEPICMLRHQVRSNVV